jgi:hypothetical protein
MSDMERFSDLSELFEFEAESMEYCDGPTEGWVRDRRTKEEFGFVCQPIVPSLLWHWFLVPRVSGEDLPHAFNRAAADRSSSGYWISVVEDRRLEVAGSCSLVRIDTRRAPPPRWEFLAGPPARA